MRANERMDVEVRDELGKRLSEALERGPAVRIPEGFAARVAADAGRVMPAAGAKRPGRLQVGTGMGLAALVCLFAVMVAMGAPSAVVPQMIQVLCAVEFMGLAIWLSLRRV